MSKNKKKVEPTTENTTIESTQTTVVGQTDAEIAAELDLLIADATTTAPVILAEIDLEQVEIEANANSAKAAAYASQESEEASAPSTVATVTPITRAPRVPRPSRAAGAKASNVLSAVMDEPALRKVAMLTEGDAESDENVTQLNGAVDDLAVKVADKAVNLLRFAGEPKKLQNYTRIGLQTLAADGQVTSKSLTEALMKAKYTLGTARSQANQLMQLLPTLKIGEKVGKAVTLNQGSTILQKFQTALTA